MLNKTSIRKIALFSCAWAALPLVASVAVAAPAYTVTDLGGGNAAAINDSGQVVVNGSQAFLYANGTMTGLGTLGGNSSYGTGINANGQVVGYSYTSGASGTPREHAFLYSGGLMSDLGTLGGDYSYAAGINNTGQVVGRSMTSSSGTYHAFLYSGGTMTDLGTLSGDTTSAGVGVNKSGEVVGWSGNLAGTVQAFFYSNGVMHGLTSLDGNNSIAMAINDSGQVVGGSNTSSGTYQAFLYSDGTMTDIGASLGPVLSRANSINDSGQAVGYYDYNSPASPIHAFLYSNGAVYDLNNLIPSGSGWMLDYASGINNLGQIVGRGVNSAGMADSFLLTPVPEPAALALFALGLAGLAIRRRNNLEANIVGQH